MQQKVKCWVCLGYPDHMLNCKNCGGTGTAHTPDDRYDSIVHGIKYVISRIPCSTEEKLERTAVQLMEVLKSKEFTMPETLEIPKATEIPQTQYPHPVDVCKCSHRAAAHFMKHGRCRVMVCPCRDFERYRDFNGVTEDVIFDELGRLPCEVPAGLMKWLRRRLFSAMTWGDWHDDERYLNTR